MRFRRSLAVVLFCLSLLLPAAVGAQDGSPVAPATPPLDLAAMALSPGDVPDGFFDDYAEWWVPAGALEGVIGDSPPPPGLERAYQTFYGSPAQSTTVHVFLLEFASPAQAAAGSTIVDAALRPPLPEGTTFGPTHAPGPALGEDSSVTTFVSYDTWAAGGPRVGIVADSFRRDRLIAGISVELYIDPPLDVSPSEAVATPVAPDPLRQQLAAELAATLDDRIRDVLAGSAPAGTDVALPDSVLPLDQLVDASTPVFGGYKSGIDLLRCGICGEENSLLTFAGAAHGGFVRGISLGPLVDGEPTPPFVAVAVSVFASPQDALAVLQAIRQAPGDLPTPYPLPRGTRTPATDPAIPGVTAATAYHASLDAEDPNAPVDSAGVDFVLGDQLVTIDVQGGLAADAAMAAAVDLATQQAACLAAPDPCASVKLPIAIANATAGQ